jgi:4-alpha-glucanotransferase
MGTKTEPNGLRVVFARWGSLWREILMDLTELAARWGIEPSYFDVQGRRRNANEATIRRIVEALSVGGIQPASGAGQARQPEPAYQGDGRKCWVLAVQLYAVRSRHNWGHGDFSDLASLLEIIARAGGAGIGLNPLHAQFYDRASCSGSPYSPNSRLFINPLYIDVAAVEEFDSGPAASIAQDIARLRNAELIDYPAVAALKIAALRAAYQRFAANGSSERRQDFESYRQERGPELASFAAFEALRAQHSGSWWQWPEQWRAPTDDALRQIRQSHPDEIGFHQFLQWNAERQLARCRDLARRHGLAIGLYVDTAVGVDAGGADAWMAQETVLRGLSVGAPPDQFNPAGQDWGLTAYNPHGLVASRFEPFRQMLRSAMRYAGAVRIDHVLGLMRLFVIPHGLPVSQGTYVRLPFAEMLAVVAEESRRWHCIAIGEDLGTVPENFRATLSAWGVWSYLVVLFERNGDGSFRRPEQYPEHAVATLNTHDLPTFAGWMSSHDLTTKRAINVDAGETEDERHHSRVTFCAAVAAATGHHTITFEAVAAFLAATPTRLVSIAVEDVLGLEDQVNVPGTVSEHPNWRRRWPLPLEELAADQRLTRIAAMFSRAGRSSAS